MAVPDPSNGAADAADQPERRAGVLTSELTDARLNVLALDRLSQAVESNARRTELVVYPLLFAFILLASYGFYLVFSLAQDVHSLAISVETNMSLLASNMQLIAGNIEDMGVDVHNMSTSVGSMADDVKTLQPMLTSMANMDQSMQQMTLNTAVMRDDMAALNRSIGRPMRVMNSFMPW